MFPQWLISRYGDPNFALNLIWTARSSSYEAAWRPQWIRQPLNVSLRPPTTCSYLVARETARIYKVGDRGYHKNITLKLIHTGNPPMRHACAYISDNNRNFFLITYFVLHTLTCQNHNIKIGNEPLVTKIFLLTVKYFCRRPRAFQT